MSTRRLSRFALLIPALAVLAIGVARAQGGAPATVKPLGDKDYMDGLKVWRMPDGNDLACAFCHSPDGIEIAAFNFGDEDIRRRATPHLGAKGAEGIVQFIHAVRRKYGITRLLDPMKDRPLQPGGEILPGKTPEERDFAFAKELERDLPTLARGDVDSTQSAEKAKAELLALDPRTLRVGIQFNRISEDGFHGVAHATFANWIADTAVRFHFPWEVYFVLQDSYLANPSDQNLLLLVEFPKLHQAKDYAQFAQLMTNDKYRALLVYQHILRKEFMRASALDEQGPVLMGKLSRALLPNPLMELGLFADARSSTPFAQFNFPDATLEKKEQGVSEADQMRQLRLPSLYAGWLMDQGLMRSAGSPPVKATDVLTQRLLLDGPYPMLDAFVITKKLVTDGYVPEAWNGKGTQAFNIDYSGFLKDDDFQKYAPKNPEERAIYDRFVANSFKMSLYLYKDEQAKGLVAEQPQGVPEMLAFLKQVDPKGESRLQASGAASN